MRDFISHFLAPLFFFLLSAVIPVLGEEESPVRTDRFRSGTVFSAEISTNKPQIADEAVYAYAAFAKSAWAELIVRFDRGRSISVYDYTLVNPAGKEYPCYAMAEGEAFYTAKDWIYPEGLDPFKYYRLLFYIEDPGPTGDMDPAYELRFKLFSTSVPAPVIPFRNMADKPFTPAGKVPRTGLLGLKYAELPWIRAVAPPPPAAAGTPPSSTVPSDGAQTPAPAAVPSSGQEQAAAPAPQQN